MHVKQQCKVNTFNIGLKKVILIAFIIKINFCNVQYRPTITVKCQSNQSFTHHDVITLKLACVCVDWTVGVDLVQQLAAHLDNTPRSSMLTESLSSASHLSQHHH